MNRIFNCIILFTVSFYSLAQPLADSREKVVDEHIKGYESIGSYSGSILVMKNGVPLLNKGFGMADYDKSLPNTSDTKFYLGSNSKIFTATSIVILEEKGLLKTEDVIQKYIDDFPSGDKITIHQLLTHTSGVSYELPLFRDEQSNTAIWEVKRSLDEQIKLLKKVPLVSEPGTKVLYSNNNYRLLAYIVEQVTRTKFGQFVTENIFTPCLMKNSGHDGTNEKIENLAMGYFPDGLYDLKVSFKIDWSNKVGHASIYSTTGDLYKFYQALFNGKLINNSSLTKMCKPYAKSNVGIFGYGLFVNEGNIYSFNGRSPGFSSEVRYYDREEKVFIVVLSNNYSSPVLRIMNKIASIYMGDDYNDITIEKPKTINENILDSFTGSYVGASDFVMPNAQLEVRRRDNYLIILWKLSGGRESILIPQSENSFLDKTFWSNIRFEKNAEGKIDRLIYRSFGKDYIALRE